MSTETQSHSDYILKLEEARNYLTTKLEEFAPNSTPSALIVLGSGLGHFATSFERKLEIAVSEIPHFESPSVSGHSGKIVFVESDDKVFILQSGRLHFYEGHSYDEINFPLRAIRMMGVENLILTNSAGSLNPNFSPGDLILIKDHINFSGFNPLLGKNISEIGPRFPDMTNVYEPAYVSKISEIANSLEIKLKQGTYFHVSGPSYETPAEVKLFFRLGGDMVGMSTVPEAIAAKHAGYKILGVSCITNFGAGIIDRELTHDDVKHEAAKAGHKFSRLIKEFIKKLS